MTSIMFTSELPYSGETFVSRRSLQRQQKLYLERTVRDIQVDGVAGGPAFGHRAQYQPQNNQQLILLCRYRSPL